MGFGFATVTPSATSVAQVGAAAVWTYPQRSLTDIQSLVSAIQNNNPSMLSTLSDILYVPAPFFAGQVSATQVAAFLNSLVLNYGLAGPAAAAISASPYGLWSTNFVTQVVPYLSNTTLNLLLSSGQMDADHAQLILYWLAQNYYYNTWVYTVTANAPSSITFSTNTVLNQNVLIAQNITIASGATITCGTWTCFFVAQSFNNYGTVVAYGAPGGVPPGSAGPGGTGGGGIVVVAITAVLGTLNVSGSPGGNAAGYIANGTGSGGSAGIFYVTSGVTVPLGGTSGGTNGYLGAAGLNGGGGGSAGANYKGAPGGNASVYLFSSPNAMATYILQGLSDWWITRTVGRPPTYVTPLAYMYGSGGGAGSENSGQVAGGGGGGGAGEVVVYGYNIVSGTVNAAGGNGGYSVSVNSVTPGGGGGGGAGGLVFIFYGATSGSVTANVAGGVGGTGSGGGTNGSAGANGTAYIVAVTVNG